VNTATSLATLTPTSQGSPRDGYYVEVGAYDGVKMSNSYFFEQQGWRGMLVEADPELAEQCRAARPHAEVVNCAVVSPDAPPTITFQVSDEHRSLSSLTFDQARRDTLAKLTGSVKLREITVPGRTLDAILDEHRVERIDFLTIDVEGHEWDVLRGFTIARWRPEIVILERNAQFPDLRIVRYMFGQGYSYLCTRGVNDWFVRRSSSAPRRVANLARFAATLYVRLPLRRVYAA
jgi:FkbM family methyltransferase